METQRVPTNLITGFLGAGKTSAILSLLPQRPHHERWAILVNEYGMVSLDHILLADGANPQDLVAEPATDAGGNSMLSIDEMAGGCFCCTLSDSLPLTLSRLIRRTNPHRLIIEPTGSGHPASVIDLLRSSPLSSRIDLQTTICLVDPRDYENPRVTNSEVFRDQIQMADVIALNFSDKCDPVLVEKCRQFVVRQDPPKLLIKETHMGKIDADWLSLSGVVTRNPLFETAHKHIHSVNSLPQETTVGQSRSSDAFAGLIPVSPADPAVVSLSTVPAPGKPVRCLNQGLGQVGFGWIFDPKDVFCHELLLDTLDAVYPVLRLKGVFHTSSDWWSIQRRGNEQRLMRSAYRRDSRIEIIAEPGVMEWPDIERRLISCLQ